MRQIITFLFIFLSLNLTAQDKFVAHDYINGNIPSYKPTFQESFPKWLLQKVKNKKLNLKKKIYIIVVNTEQ